MDEIYNRFTDFVISNSLIRSGDRVLLSLSAGKDSMFMLDLLNRLREEIPFETGVFHLNHLTRGAESDGDERFVAEKCRVMNIPCYTERFDFSAGRTPSKSFEEQARDVRYSLLHKLALSENYSKIATAHNMNDNAETVLMRVLSGTGISGLKGILPSVKNIIRPVLFAEKNEIYQYLESNSIVWREDRTNSENVYLRNHLRNVIIPIVNERFPNAERNLNNLASHAAENINLLNDFADAVYPGTVQKHENEIIISVDKFAGNIPVIKYFISRVLSEYLGLKIKISVFNEMIRRYETAQANMVLYVKDNLVIRKGLKDKKRVLVISTEENMWNLPGEWEYTFTLIPGNSIIIPEINLEVRVEEVSRDFFAVNRTRNDMLFIRYDAQPESVILRNRRRGDRIKTENGTRKIKDLMIEKKLDSIEKNSIPLIVADGNIAAYLPGLHNSDNNRVACNFRISNDTKRILAFFFRNY